MGENEQDAKNPLPPQRASVPVIAWYKSTEMQLELAQFLACLMAAYLDAEQQGMTTKVAIVWAIKSAIMLWIQARKPYNRTNTELFDGKPTL